MIPSHFKKIIKSLLVTIWVFQFGAITNNTAINILLCVFWFAYIHNFLKNISMKYLGHWVCVFSVSVDTDKVFQHCHTILLPQAVYETFCHSKSFPKPFITGFTIYSHSGM